MDALQILLLGPPDVLWNGVPVRIPRRSLRAMLYYLACNGQISRSELYSRFWPEESEHKAQANLRTALTRLRDALPDASLVIATPDHISLERDRVTVDVFQFNHLVEQTAQVAAQLPSTALLPQWVVDLMNQAVQIWRSPHFMAGFTFPDGSPELDHWQSLTSQILESDYLRMLVRLADHYSLAGDLDAAQHYLLDALEVNAYDSELNARVLRYMLIQNRAGAQAFADSLQARYADEGEEMPDELVELCRQARKEDRADLEDSEDWPVRLSTQVHLVNRRQELAQLQKAYWRGGTAVLWGEAGSGKTRLTVELYRMLSPRPRLLYLSAFQIETSLPFQALIDALRRSVSPTEWQNLPKPWRLQLAYLLPELSESPQVRQIREKPLSEVLPGNLFEALRQLFIQLSGSRKIMLVVDQAQWVDESTLTALAYLVDRGFFAEHGLLLLAARTEEPALELERFLQQSRTQKSILHVRLGPLHQPDVADLAQLVLGRTLNENQIGRLTRETGGIPLFILETLRALIEDAPALDLDSAFEMLPVGGSLYVLLQERLNRLRPAARQVAAAAAVAGDEANLEMVASVAQMEVEEVIQALEELAQAKIIQILPADQQIRFTFLYRQMVEVIRWVLGPARLRLLHLRAARAIESLHTDIAPLAASLAQHYEAAGEAQLAVQYWIKAGRHALSLISFHEAVLAFRAADRLAQRFSDMLPDRLLNELYTYWADIAYEQTDPQVLQENGLRLRQMGEDRHSGLLLGSAYRIQGDLYALLKEPERSLDAYNQAEFYLKPLGERLELVRLYNRMGLFFIAHLRYQEAEAVLEQARALANESQTEDIVEQRATAECSLGTLYNLTGWPDKAQRIVEPSLWQVRSPVVMYGHLVMSVAKLHTGERLAALEHARLGLQIAQQIPNWRMAISFMAAQARAALSMGQLDEAWQALQAGLTQAQTNRIIDRMTILRTIMGDLYRLLGDLPKAIQLYQEGMAEGEKSEDYLGCQALLAQALADSGNIEQALPLVEQAYHQSRQLNLASTYIPAMATWALILAQSGQNLKSVAVMEEWLTAIQDRNYRSYALVEKVVLFQRALLYDNVEEAGRLAHEAVLMGQTFGSPWWELLGYQLHRMIGPLGTHALIQVEEILNRIQQNGRNPEFESSLKEFLLKRRSSLLSK